MLPNTQTLFQLLLLSCAKWTECQAWYFITKKMLCQHCLLLPTTALVQWMTWAYISIVTWWHHASPKMQKFWCCSHEHWKNCLDYPKMHMFVHHPAEPVPEDNNDIYADPEESLHVAQLVSSIWCSSCRRWSQYNRKIGGHMIWSHES
jgi:hypothetical protein